MRNKLTYYVSIGGLVALGIAFTVWLQANTPGLGTLGAIVSGLTAPALLLYACIRKTRNWSGIAALCMIPFAVIGVMDIVATLGAPDAGMAVGIFSIVTFFTVLDAGRREPD